VRQEADWDFGTMGRERLSGYLTSDAVRNTETSHNGH
jgi:hypothetical protein